VRLLKLNRKEFSSALNRLLRIAILIFAGIAPNLTVVIMSAFESTEAVAKTLDWLFNAIFPQYSLGSGVTNMNTNYQLLDACFNRLPEAMSRTPGKASLDKICERIEILKDGPFGHFFEEMSNPCCKGEQLIDQSINQSIYKFITPQSIIQLLIGQFINQPINHLVNLSTVNLLTISQSIH